MQKGKCVASSHAEYIVTMSDEMFRIECDGMTCRMQRKSDVTDLVRICLTCEKCMQCIKTLDKGFYLN